MNSKLFPTLCQRTRARDIGPIGIFSRRGGQEWGRGWGCPTNQNALKYTYMATGVGRLKNMTASLDSCPVK